MLCDAEHHNFIVTEWDADPTGSQAVKLVCSHCLAMIGYEDVKLRHLRFMSKEEVDYSRE